MWASNKQGMIGYALTARVRRHSVRLGVDTRLPSYIGHREYHARYLYVPQQADGRCDHAKGEVQRESVEM